MKGPVRFGQKIVENSPNQVRIVDDEDVDLIVNVSTMAPLRPSESHAVQEQTQDSALKESGVVYAVRPPLGSHRPFSDDALKFLSFPPGKI